MEEISNMKEIDNNLLVIMEFLEATGISLEDLKLSYNKEKRQLYFCKEEYAQDEEIRYQGTVELNTENSSIVIHDDICHKYDFRVIDDDPMMDWKTYTLDSHQTITKYKVIGGKLNKYTATISQTVREDTFGGGKGIIVDFYSISDCLDKSRKDCLSFYNQMIPITKESYDISEDYKITDGLSNLEVLNIVKKIK